ncbi:hypothetical protein FRC17_001342 [Serendipita sp. 399]|nr:hypothetical protein FRC17_001342 [Serendipita sp. 399]
MSKRTHRTRQRTQSDDDSSPVEEQNSTIETAKAIKRETIRRLLNWNEIPDWQRDNEYILSGYRGELKSLSKCLNSAFTYLHNETVNIQSHWIGGLLFISIWIYHLRGVFQEHNSSIDITDEIFMTLFMTGALICLFLSGTFHMMTCHSKPVHDIFHRLDYAGIVTLTVGSFYPAVYYGFYCDSKTAAFWLALLTLSGAGTAYTVLSPTYATPEYRRTRAYLFIALGLSGALPVIQLLIKEGYSHLGQIGINWLLLSAALYIGGAVL